MERTPASKLSKTPFSAGAEPSSLVFMIESRAREVGLAALNLTSFEICLCQFVDTLQYSNAANIFYALSGQQLVLSKTAEGEALHIQLCEQLDRLTVVFAPRRLFDELKGVELYRQACVKVEEVDYESKYVCMAALAALHTYLEVNNAVRLCSAQLKITFLRLEQYLSLDAETAKLLALITDKDGNASQSLSSLYKCCTPMGQRLARSRLLQPYRDRQLICNQQEAVTELINNAGLRGEVMSLLTQAPNTDALTARLVQQVGELSDSTFRYHILSIMALKQALQVSKRLHSTFLRYQPQSCLLKHLLRSLEDARIDYLLSEIDRLVDESILYNKSQSQNKLQSLYLLRTGTYSLLDIARKVYTDTVDQIYRLADSYKAQLHDPKLKVVYTDSRKYHLELTDSRGDEFIQVTKLGKKTLATTVQLAALSDRATSAASEILKLTYQFIEELLCKARGKMPCVYNAAHALAELDVMASYAAYAVLTPTCRPSVTGNNEMHVTASRHPLLEATHDLVPNDLHLSAETCIVTGVNASGKSTLLTQTALLVIMTQVGSYIPATAAEMPVFDQVFTRAGEADSLEQKSSSFMMEMKGLAYILRGATSHSLVLIDELCKGTALEDGFALAWAVCEELAKRGCMALVATHMQQLALMQGRVPCLRNLLLDQHLAREGCIQVRKYGLEAARNSALPPEVVDLAYEVYERIEARTRLLLV